jgi:hypothetical protein
MTSGSLWSDERLFFLGPMQLIINTVLFTVPVQIQGWDNSEGLGFVIRGDSGYAARAACQISDIVALRPPSWPILNCCFLICQFDATNDDYSVSEALQPQHRAKTLLYSSMVLFDQIVSREFEKAHEAASRRVIRRMMPT